MECDVKLDKRSIGILGGTFDPPHFGHLNLAIEVLEKGLVDEVWMCPVNISPHKLHSPPTDALERLEMVNLAIKGIPHLKVTEIEIRKDGPSYTIDTLRELYRTYPNEQFFIILGDDALINFPHWKEPLEILKLAKPIVANRLEIKTKDEELLKYFQDCFVPIRRMDISATEIRQRIRKQKCCKHLVPKEVLDFIIKNRLYL